jgi:AcrR family transcriptional regulator
MTAPGAGSAPGSRKAQAGKTRRRLLAAAIEHFSSAHYDDVMVSQLAEGAGVAHGVVFHHFASKRGIYLEAVREAGRRLDDAEHTSPAHGPGAQIRALLSGHLEFMAANQDLALRLILSGSSADPEVWEIFEQRRWARIGWTCELLGLDASNVALRQALRSVTGAIDEATVFWLKNGQPFPVTSLTEAFLTLLTAGLAAAAALDPSLDVSPAVAALDDRTEECRSA